ncbi:hypothetical protein SAMN04487897_12466 [Paenibacillus sp. yr247]|uniref:hypothetical protein n=1 Tax=Paenibacillus sp. yr247 TaxID=1761880 RepID=UPI000887263F|nr:hypothetical protein [Paenibacillus sp. yr247]SDO85492.1 hypothetical protein SAMN04487897_12466 [Paenibacillus sp. yr247]
MSDRHKDINKMIRQAKIIVTGSKRIVYDLRNGYVLKVAKSKYGIISNKREVFTYTTAPSCIKKHLANILDHGNEYGWIIMKKYKPNLPKSKGYYKRKLFKLRAKFRKNGIIPYEVVNYQGYPNYHNLGLRSNGEIIVIDYGNFKFYKCYFKRN